jgi:hypothetical protein
MEATTLSRQQLYELIWSTPMSTLAKTYQISDSGLRKIAIRMGIPIPLAGYWQKIRAGKKVAVPPLKADYKGENEVKLQPKTPDDQPQGPSELALLQKEIENDKRLPLKIQARLTDPDPMIVAAKNTLENKEHRDHRYEGIYSTYRDQLNIRVSTALTGKAIRFMDTFIKCLRIRGHAITIIYDKTCVMIGEQKLEISLRERLKREEGKNSWQQFVNVPEGTLLFKMDSYPRYEWKDSKHSLEEQLPHILAKLELQAKKDQEDAIRRKIEHERYLEEEKKRKAYEQLKEKELDDFRTLLKDAKRWRDIEWLRSFLAAAEQRIDKTDPLQAERMQWLEWAKQKVDWYDPTVNREDELLSDVDKGTLTFKKKGFSW